MIKRFTKGAIILGLGLIIGCGRMTHKTKQFVKDPFNMEGVSEVRQVEVISVNDFINRGKTFFQKGDFKAAAKEFEDAAKINPNSAQIHYSLGLAYYELREFSDAVKEYTMALELQPDFAEAYFNQGVAYYKMDEVEKALQSYGKAMKYGIEDAVIHFNIGLCFLKLSKFKEAKREYQRAVEIEPGFAEAYNNLGYIAETEADFDTAKNMYSKALTIREDYLMAKQNLDCLTQGIVLPEKSTRVEKDSMGVLSVETEGAWVFNRDITLNNTTVGDVDIGSGIKKGLFRLGYHPTHWLDLFLDIGLTDFELKDPEIIDSSLNIIEGINHISNSNYSKYDGFKNVIGPAGGLGFAIDIYEFKRIKLGFDTGFEFLIGTNKDELKEGDSVEITSKTEWKEYNLLLRARYLGFNRVVPYIGGTFSKLDGDFEMEYSGHGTFITADYNETDPLGLLVGSSFYLGKNLRFQTEARFINEASVALKLRYGF